MKSIDIRTITVQELENFYNQIEDCEISPFSTRYGENNSGMIYLFKKYYIVLHGRVSNNFTDYCNISTFETLSEAEKFLDKVVKL